MKTEQSRVVIAVVALVTLAWAFRWDVTPLNGGDSRGGAYMLNRWTGTVYFVFGVNSREVVPYKPEPKFIDFDTPSAPTSGAATK